MIGMLSVSIPTLTDDFLLTFSPMLVVRSAPGAIPLSKNDLAAYICQFRAKHDGVTDLADAVSNNMKSGQDSTSGALACLEFTQM